MLLLSESDPLDAQLYAVGLYFPLDITTPSKVMRSDQPASKLEILLEAARRATWDALKGPRHLRAGRFRSLPDTEKNTTPLDVPTDV